MPQSLHGVLFTLNLCSLKYEAYKTHDKPMNSCIIWQILALLPMSALHRSSTATELYHTN